jgi:hypothetical protein
MTAARVRLVALDRRQIDVTAGVVGVVVVALLAVAVVAWGPVAMAAVVGALVMLVADPPTAGRGRIAALAPLGAGGALVTLVAVAVRTQPVLAALVVGAVAVVASLHAGRSRSAGTRGLVATIWVILAVTLPDSGARPIGYAAAFAAGAVVGAVVTLLRSRVRPEPAGLSSDEAAGSGTPSPVDGAAAKAGLIRFSLLSGIGLGVSVLVGFTWFPAHPAWVAITALLVMRPPMAEALVVGVQRSLGTAVGVLLAVAVSGIVGDNTAALVVLFLASAFLMMAVREANYALFAVFVTTLVIYLQRLVGAEAADSGVHRLIETVVGVLVAFVVLGVNEVIGRARGGART